MVRLQYELSRADFLAMERVRVSLWQRWPGWILMGIFGVICLGVGLFALLSTRPDDRPGGWWVLPAVFLFTLSGARVERWWRRERAWRAARAAGVIVADFTDAGLGIAAGAERAFLEWRAFTHYRETPELLLIYQGKSFFRYFPLSVFRDNPAALNEVRRILHTHVRLTRYEPRGAAPGGFPVAAAAAVISPPAEQSPPAGVEVMPAAQGEPTPPPPAPPAAPR